MAIGKIAVLGGGPGSQATAAALALRGFEVHFWGRNPRKLASLFKYKEIKIVGYINETAKLADAGDDLGRTLKDAKVVIITLPGFAQRDVAERCAPFVEEGQIFLTCDLSGMGSLEFARTFREKGIDRDVLCAEWSGIPNGGRLLEADVVNTGTDFTFQIQHYGMHVGVFPAKRTEEAMEVISQVYPGVPSAENCLASSLNIRAAMHQAVIMLMSATAIENFVYWNIMGEGHTPSTLRVMKAVDDERKAIQKGWGFKVTELYGSGHFSGEKLDLDKIGASGIPVRAHRDKAAWKDRLNMKHRFVTEAVPYGYALRSSAAAKAGLKVPITDSLIHIFSVINGEDYFSSGRNLNNLGLGRVNVEQVKSFLSEGYH